MMELQRFFEVSNLEKEQILARYDKTQSDVNDDVQILQTWLQKQRHIPELEDNLFLEQFLLRNKFQIEKTKLKVDKYFTMKTVYADFFEKLDPCDQDIVLATKYFHVSVMSKLTSEQRRVVYITFALDDEKDFNHTALTQALTIAIETQIRMDYTDSIELVMDAKSFTMSLIPKIDLSMFTKSTKVYFEAFSGRIGGVHILNASQAVEILLSMFKPLLPAKLRNKIKIYSTPADILKNLPEECLPTEIGGTGPSALKTAKALATTLKTARSYILQRNRTSTNEKLRIGKQTVQVDMFGIDGTFKKINID